MHQVAVSMVSLLQSLDASVAVGLALIRLLVEDALFAIAIIALSLPFDPFVAVGVASFMYCLL
jgi:hypothetical protein